MKETDYFGITKRCNDINNAELVIKMCMDGTQIR